MDKRLILILIAIIVLAFTAFSFTKQDVQLNVWAEEIPNTQDIYFVCELHDSNGKLIDTSLGKFSIELFDSRGNSIGSDEVPLDHGKVIARLNGEYEKVNVHYDGGYIFNPCDYSNDLTIIEDAGVTDENLTCSF